MKAVARLVALYFSGSTSARVFTLIGVAVIVGGSVFNYWFDPMGANSRGADPVPWWLAALAASPLAGFVALIFGSALLPKIVGQLAVSRRTWLLPSARAKIIVSALATIVVLACLVTVAYAVLLLNMVPERVSMLARSDLVELAEVVATIFTLAFAVYSLLHVGLWLVGRFDSALGILTGVLLLVGALALTMRVLSLLRTQTLFGLVPVVSILLWVLIAFAIAFAPRLHTAWPRYASRLRRLLRLRLPERRAEVPGHELELALGTARPWAFGAGLVVPFGAALWFCDDPTVWSFYLALFAAILGGLASFAAARTRRLWLRTNWDRRVLFRKVERAYWRHTAFGVAALWFCHVVLGRYTALSTVSIAWGLLTLALGAVACMYLALTITRGIGWRGAVVTVGTMILLMATASFAANATASVAVVASLEATLLTLAIAYRTVAVRRWTGLDWSFCRGDSEAGAMA